MRRYPVQYYLQQPPIDDNTLVMLPHAHHEAAHQSMDNRLGNFDRQLPQAFVQRSPCESEASPVGVASTRGRKHRRQARRLLGAGTHFSQNGSTSLPPQDMMDDLIILTQQPWESYTASTTQTQERTDGYLLGIGSQYPVEYVGSYHMVIEDGDMRAR